VDHLRLGDSINYGSDSAPVFPCQISGGRLGLQRLGSRHSLVPGQCPLGATNGHCNHPRLAAHVTPPALPSAGDRL
jgi:hypothetical protein